MIPNGAAYENFPPFANSGTRSAPAEAKYAQGMVPADTFPAEWANYFFHGATAGITRLNADTGSIKKEINSVLEAYNITPDASVYNQLLSALSKIYPQMCECSTPAATAAKSVALQGNVLKAGNVYLITMTYGNTAANPTLSINSGTAYPMCDANGHALASGAWEDGDMIKVLFTGTKYLMATRAVKNTITAGDKSPINSDAVINYILIQGVPLGAITAFYGTTPPNGYLLCDGSEFSATAYPALYTFLGDNHTPDLRECALVGVGQSDNDYDAATNPTGIQDHDVYTLGEFKDDQLQEHTHMAWIKPGQLPMGGSSAYFTATGEIATGINNGRSGTVTRGKRKGVNYIIKAV